jgi:glucosamine 6-phosphate synthetase-like amidotransferase/phosphosugar isomerase protein
MATESNQTKTNYIPVQCCTEVNEEIILLKDGLIHNHKEYRT